MTGRGDSFVESSYVKGVDIQTVAAQIRSGEVFQPSEIRALFYQMMENLKKGNYIAILQFRIT